MHVKVLLIFLIFMSCSSSKLLNGENLQTEVPVLIAIEGTYLNQSTSLSNQNVNFTEYYKPFNVSHKKLQYPRKPESVSISIFQKTKIRFTENYSNGDLITYDFKYKIKDNILIINGFSNLELIGVPFLFYRLQYQILNFGISNDENLIIGSKGEASGGILIVGFGEPIKSIQIFEKIND